MEQIRHTYLHYLLDPMALKYPVEVKRLQPCCSRCKASPMDESFKQDMALLVTECMIRAVEARMTGSGKDVEAQRQQAVAGFGKTGIHFDRIFLQHSGTV